MDHFRSFSTRLKRCGSKKQSPERPKSFDIMTLRNINIELPHYMSTNDRRNMFADDPPTSLNREQESIFAAAEGCKNDVKGWECHERTGGGVPYYRRAVAVRAAGSSRTSTLTRDAVDTEGIETVEGGKGSGSYEVDLSEDRYVDIRTEDEILFESSPSSLDKNELEQNASNQQHDAGPIEILPFWLFADEFGRTSIPQNENSDPASTTIIGEVCTNTTQTLKAGQAQAQAQSEYIPSSTARSLSTSSSSSLPQYQATIETDPDAGSNADYRNHGVLPSISPPPAAYRKLSRNRAQSSKSISIPTSTSTNPHLTNDIGITLTAAETGLFLLWLNVTYGGCKQSQPQQHHHRPTDNTPAAAAEDSHEKKQQQASQQYPNPVSNLNTNLTDEGAPTDSPPYQSSECEWQWEDETIPPSPSLAASLTYSLSTTASALRHSTSSSSISSASFSTLRSVFGRDRSDIQTFEVNADAAPTIKNCTTCDAQTQTGPKSESTPNHTPATNHDNDNDTYIDETETQSKTSTPPTTVTVTPPPNPNFQRRRKRSRSASAGAVIALMLWRVFSHIISIIVLSLLLYWVDRRCV